MSEQTAAPQEDAPEIVSAFPLPPAFFTLYQDGVESGPPPPAPMAPQYHMFGTPFSTQDVVPDLLPMPGKKLYVHSGDAAGKVVDGTTATASAVPASGPAASALGDSVEPIDFKTEMKKINHSLLANFMELVDVLTKKPVLFNEKLDDLELLFLNMHNLINAFRPHQARETIIHMMENQIQERRDAAQELRRTIDEARRTVEEVHSQLHDTASDDLSRSQDIDIKMEDADDIVAADASESSSGEAPTAAATSVIAKTKEIQQMQDAFFAALQSVTPGH